MTEHVHDSHKKHEQEAHPYGEYSDKHPETAHSKAEKENPGSSESISYILKKVELASRSSEQLTKDHLERSKHDKYPTHHAGDHLKSHGSKQTLHHVQKQLKKPERAFSKVIHNQAVEGVSTVVGESVARPSGLLAGGVCSVLGSIGVLLVCRFYGYEYNYLIGIVCFGGGFFLGLLVEAIWKLTQRRV